MPTGNSAARRVSAAIVLAFGLCGAPLAATAQESDWIGVWSASPQADWGADFFAPVGIPRSLRDQTIRQVARVSLGGEKVRIEFSNEYGNQPMTMARRTRLAGADRAIDPARQGAHLRRQARATIPPGAPIWSDPVDLSVKALDSLAVSLYLPRSRRPRPGTTRAGRPPGSARAIRPPPKASLPISPRTPAFS